MQANLNSQLKPSFVLIYNFTTWCYSALLSEEIGMRHKGSNPCIAIFGYYFLKLVIEVTLPSLKI